MQFTMSSRAMLMGSPVDSALRMLDKYLEHKNKEKMFSKQLASDVVIVFLVQCSQGSKEQTDHHQKKEEELQCSLVNCLRWSAVKMRETVYYLTIFLLPSALSGDS